MGDLQDWADELGENLNYVASNFDPDLKGDSSCRSRSIPFGRCCYECGLYECNCRCDEYDRYLDDYPIYARHLSVSEASKLPDTQLSEARRGTWVECLKEIANGNDHLPNNMQAAIAQFLERNYFDSDHAGFFEANWLMNEELFALDLTNWRGLLISPLTIAEFKQRIEAETYLEYFNSYPQAAKFAADVSGRLRRYPDSEDCWRVEYVGYGTFIQAISTHLTFCEEALRLRPPLMICQEEG